MFGKRFSFKASQAEPTLAPIIQPITPQTCEISQIAAPSSHIDAAEKLLLIFDFAQAETVLDAYLQTQPAQCDAWHALGHSCALQGKQLDAIEAYSRAIDVAYRYHSIIHFEHSAVCLQRAKLLYKQDHDEAALHDINQAVFQDHANHAALHIKNHGWDAGRDVPAYMHHSITQLSIEQEIQRKRLTYYALAPQQKAHDRAIYDWRQNQPNKALDLLSRIVQENADDCLSWHHMGLIYLELGEDIKALEAFNHAIEAGKKRHQRYHHGASLHHYHRGLMQFGQNALDLALIDFTKAAEIDVSNAPALAALAQIAHQNGQRVDGLSLIDKALALQPNALWQQHRACWA